MHEAQDGTTNLNKPQLFPLVLLLSSAQIQRSEVEYSQFNLRKEGARQPPFLPLPPLALPPL